MIETRSLTKRYRGNIAVDDVSFTVQPGRVTGFLGPNGAGKSTTMRMIVGLDRPTSGRAIVNGKPYASHASPLSEVGVLLDAGARHPGRSAREHLLAIARTHRIGRRRVDEVIGFAGLDSVARTRAGKYSLGMGQRLGIAAALLGDPATLILDEPVNGLDPEGVAWMRRLLKDLAAEGRTVFVSSHLMTEMAMTADHLVILGKGRVLADAPLHEIVAGTTAPAVRVRTSRTAELAVAVSQGGTSVTRIDGETLELRGVAASDVARIAERDRITLVELTTVTSSLEDAYMALTADAVEYRSGRQTEGVGHDH